MEDVKAFEVSPIALNGRVYSFEIVAIYEDGTKYRIAIHEIQTHQSLEIFRWHHAEMIRLYTSLD